MRKLEVNRQTIITESGATQTVVYYLTIDANPENSATPDTESYGVAVYIPETDEAAFVSHITPLYSRILALSKVLEDNLVTPVTLRDIVCDWICEN